MDFCEEENVGSIVSVSDIFYNLLLTFPIATINYDIPKWLEALDYNDKSEISGWGMPSSRYINLTLGASGTVYTAPANGYFAVHTDNIYCYRVYNSTKNYGITSYGKSGFADNIKNTSKKSEIYLFSFCSGILGKGGGSELPLILYF